MNIDTHRIYSLLKQYWGYDSFRPLQEEIVTSIIAGNDTLAILPTGGGKSLCYQLPGLYNNGLTLVVSPLIALMKDQIEGLKSKGIKAIGIMSGQSIREQDILFDNAAYGNAKFLFLSPERLKSKYSQDRIEKLNIKLVAIDEAHCISEWGHDFRPEYREIAALKDQLIDVPFIALTATATPSVAEDIKTNLQLKEPKTFAQSPIRKNLSYHVIYSENKKTDILDIVRTTKGCCLIYVQKRKTARELQNFFMDRRMKAESFHGGLDVKLRSKIIEDWNKDDLQLIIATKAFGMGMDKPNVRTVIHYQPSDALEAYVQEAGRAGRDQLPARAIMLWNKYDIKSLRENINNYYPSLEFIHKTYNSLKQFYKLGKGLNSLDWKNFNISEFSAFAKSKISITSHALNLLKKANYINLSPSFLHPSKLMLFEGSTKNMLKNNNVSDKMKSFIKTILRTYDGIFLEERKIDEKILAKKAEVKMDQAKEALKWLQNREVLKYSPTFDGHKISFNGFIHNVDQIVLDDSIYKSQKQRLKECISSITAYIDFVGCRQVFISKYFGFINVDACGCCDNCETSNFVIEEDQGSYQKMILNRISNNINDLDDLIKSFHLKEKEVIINAIDYLIEEEKINIKGKKVYLINE